MSEMFGEIMGRRGEMRDIYDADESARLKAEASQRRAQEQMRLHEENERRMQQEAERIGKDFAGLLKHHRVPSQPVFSRPNNQSVQEVGRGWHVHTIAIHEGADVPPGSMKFILQDNGSVSTYSQSSYTADGRSGDLKGKHFEGILFPTKPLVGSRAHRELTGNNFLNGIASLIEVGRPYVDPAPYDV